MKSVTRDRIIGTASELFYKRGYNLTGINEIIEESGIAKATLYNHFKSKEELLLAYLDSRNKEALRDIQAFCKSKPRGNKRLIAVLEFLIPFYNQDDFNGCWCVRSIAEVPRENHEVRVKIRNGKNQFCNFLKELVEESKPNLKKTEQDELARQLYVLYEGAMTESHLHDADWPIKSAISLLKDKLKES